MGRMLEALKRPDTFRVAPEPPAVPAPEAPDGLDTPGPEGDIPVIEVGPANLLEGSPDVLGSRPGAAPAARAEAKAPGVTLFRPRPPAPRGVAFRPLAAEAAPEEPEAFAPELVAYHDPDDPV